MTGAESFRYAPCIWAESARLLRPPGAAGRLRRHHRHHGADRPLRTALQALIARRTLVTASILYLIRVIDGRREAGRVRSTGLD